MTDYVYDKSGQRLFFVREGTTYGDPYDPEGELYTWGTNSTLGDTPVLADYPHWRRFDLIPDNADVVIPLIKKLERFDISDSKHPSQILSGEIEPVNFTLDMVAQGCEFLPLAVGAPSLTSHDQAMVQTITCVADSSSSLNSKYFFLDCINTNVTKHYLIWIDVGSAGSAPTVTGINNSNRVEVDIAADATASTVATAVASAINGLTEFSASATSSVVTVTAGASYKGACQPAHDSGSSTATGFSFGVTTWGSTEYTVTEAVTTDIPSFTIHVEQQNTTSTEDIIWDLYGCVIDSVELDLTWGDGVGKLSVTFQCPFAAKSSNRNTNNPPRKYIKPFPVMNCLQESASNYLIQEGTDDRTPKNVEKVVLTINNAVDFKSSNAYRHAIQACATKREITLQIVGNTHENELFNYYLEAFTNDGTDWYPTNATGLLNSVIKLQRDATYDYIEIKIRNWWIQDHSFSFVSVDDAVKSVDMTFKDGTPDSNGRIISSFTFQSYIDETIIVG